MRNGSHSGQESFSYALGFDYDALAKLITNPLRVFFFAVYTALAPCCKVQTVRGVQLYPAIHRCAAELFALRKWFLLQKVLCTISLVKICNAVISFPPLRVVALLSRTQTHKTCMVYIIKVFKRFSTGQCWKVNLKAADTGEKSFQKCLEPHSLESLGAWGQKIWGYSVLPKKCVHAQKTGFRIILQFNFSTFEVIKRNI